MIKELLCWWIILQLILIGWAGGTILINYRDNCPDQISLQEALQGVSNFKIYLISIMIPLAFFLPDEDLCINN